MRNDLVPRQLPITGPPHLVRTALETQLRQGRLLSHPQDLKLSRNPDGTVTVFATVLVDQQRSWARRHRPQIAAATGLAAVAALFALVLLIVHAVKSAAGALDGPAALGVLSIVGALILVGMVNRSNHRGACPGIAVHCKGCKH